MSLDDLVDDFQLALEVGGRRNDRLRVDDDVVRVAVVENDGDFGFGRRNTMLDVDELVLRRNLLLLVVEDELRLLLDVWNVLRELLNVIDRRQEELLLRRCLRRRQVIQLNCVVDGVELHQQLLGLRRLLAEAIRGGVVAGHEVV